MDTRDLRRALDERAARAPVADPLAFDLVIRRGRKARRRRVLGGAISLTVALTIVALAALLVDGGDDPSRVALRSDDGTAPVTAGPTSSPEAARSTTPTELTLATFMDELENRGHAVSLLPPSGGAAFPSPFDVEPQLVCLDGVILNVYEYASAAERDLRSRTIAPDGSKIGDFIIEWTGPPHFYAAGQIVVLYAGTSVAVQDTLAQIVGDTITPAASGARGPGDRDCAST